MRNLTTILLLFIACSTQAQTDSLARARASIKAISDHGYLAVMVGQDYNYAINQLTDYLRAEEGMTVLQDSYQMNDSGELEMKAIKSVSSSDQSITIKTKLSNGLIDYVIIEGYYDYVLDVFVGYYDTSIEMDERKPGETVYRMLITDRMALSFLSGETAKLVVSK